MKLKNNEKILIDYLDVPDNELNGIGQRCEGLIA